MQLPSFLAIATHKTPSDLRESREPPVEANVWILIYATAVLHEALHERIQR